MHSCGGVEKHIAVSASSEPQPPQSTTGQTVEHQLRRGRSPTSQGTTSPREPNTSGCRSRWPSQKPSTPALDRRRRIWWRGARGRRMRFTRSTTPHEGLKRPPQGTWPGVLLDPGPPCVEAATVVTWLLGALLGCSIVG